MRGRAVSYTHLDVYKRQVLENSNGTAPGLVMPASGSLPMFILLPGPPSELKPMVEPVSYTHLTLTK